jgi:YbbR-like protein
MSEHSGKRLFRFYLRKLKFFFISKDLLSFLFFLALSATFWFVHALDKSRETTITIPIHYVGVPHDIAIKNNPPSEITITVKDQGLRLFSYSKENGSPLNIDLSKLLNKKGEILISSALLRTKVTQYLLPTTSIMDMKTDSFYIQCDKLHKAIKPIVLNSKIELATQYMLSQKIELIPNKVEVFGPKSIIDTLKYIYTELVEVKNLNDTMHLVCKLLPVAHVKFATEQIKVNLFVEHFTEKHIQLPITSINCPPNFSIRTFPAFVNVSYFVGLSKFRNTNQNDIQVYLDYNDLQKSNDTKLKLKIKNNTSYLTNIRVYPEEAEFLLEKK